MARTTPKNYIPIDGVFAAFVAAMPVVLNRKHKVDDYNADWRELFELSVSTYELSRIIVKEKAGAPLRAPFVQEREGAEQGDMSGDNQRPRGEGVRAAIGELVTCTRCTGVWSAASLLTLRMAAPRHGKVVLHLLTAAGVNNFLQAGFAYLCDREPTVLSQDELPAIGSSSGETSGGGAENDAASNGGSRAAYRHSRMTSI